MTRLNLKLLFLMMFVISLAMAIRVGEIAKGHKKDKVERCCPQLKRPLERKYYTDEDYYAGKETVTYKLDKLAKYTCSEDSAVDNKWKEALTFGKTKGYYRTDKAKIFNKALGDIESATSNLDTITCVSATVLHLLKYKDCAIWQTTTDVIFARIEYFGLGLSVSDILAKAEEQVKSHSKKFKSQHDCCEYTPKAMPGSVFEKPFDCDDPLVIPPGVGTLVTSFQ